MNDGCMYQGFTSDPQVYIRGYRDQAIYITRRIEQVIDQILARSPEPPVVILQGDHGSGLRLVPESKEKSDLHERMSILNAYYFPDRKYQALYPEITPVNSFRVVLNTYFDAGLKLLPDRNYFSTWSHPLEFMDVTSAIRTPTDEPSGSSNLSSRSVTEGPRRWNSRNALRARTSRGSGDRSFKKSLMFAGSLRFYPGGQWSSGGTGDLMAGGVHIKPVGVGTTLEQYGREGIYRSERRVVPSRTACTDSHCIPR